MSTRVLDARNINELMNEQKDISPRFAGEGLDYQTRQADRSPETMANVEKLLKDGYVVIEKAVSADLCRKIKAAVHREQSGYHGHNYFEGETTRRTDHLVNKLSVVEPLVLHPKVLNVLDHVLNPNYLLSASQAIEVLPGEHKQPWHNDDNYTRMARPRKFFFVNCFWAIDDFTRANGGTHIIPGSHLWGEDRLPEANDHEQGIQFVAPAGSVCMFVSTAWHSAGANTTDKSRMAVACVYGEPWIRPYENHFLVTSPSDLIRMPPKLQSLLGYSVCTPLVGRVNGQHPIKALAREGAAARVRYVDRTVEEEASL
ncbi:phytanoyl-CoA dioxygenase family protein [Hyaloraphidium curvatum]|nr:phytanoyl-CoA dioxygenase family protein [Hyaloraphidium curvatum]